MKKLIAAILVAALFASVCYAEEKTVTYHSAFGLSEGATQEEILKAISETFSVRTTEENEKYYFPDHQYLYGIPIDCIRTDISDLIYIRRGIEVSFTDESLSAENVATVYEQLCSAFGDPTVCNISKSVVTINGKEDVPVSVDSLDEIQLAIEQYTINGTVCWDNISLCFSAYILDMGVGDKEHISFKIDVAFSEATLKREVISLYNLNPYGR